MRVALRVIGSAVLLSFLVASSFTGIGSTIPGTFSAGSYQVGGVLLCSGTAPTISSGFGTSPSIPTNNGTCAFTVNVGSTATASGVIGLPTATTGWVVACNDITTTSSTTFITKQTAGTTTTATIGNFNTSAASANWTANDILRCSAFGY